MNYPRLPTMRVELTVPPSWTGKDKAPDLKPVCRECVSYAGPRGVAECVLQGRMVVGSHTAPKCFRRRKTP